MSLGGGFTCQFPTTEPFYFMKDTPTPDKPKHRQREWQQSMLSQGRCINCGSVNDTTTQRCTPCRKAYNDYHRKHHGHREWSPGSVGRPPKTN